MYTFFEVSKKEMRWVGRFLGRTMYLKFETHSLSMFFHCHLISNVASFISLPNNSRLLVEICWSDNR